MDEQFVEGHFWSQMALKGVEREDSSNSETEEEYGHRSNGNHSNGVAMTPQDQLSPVSAKDFQERAL